MKWYFVEWNSMKKDRSSSCYCWMICFKWYVSVPKVRICYWPEDSKNEQVVSVQWLFYTVENGLLYLCIMCSLHVFCSPPLYKFKRTEPSRQSSLRKHILREKNMQNSKPALRTLSANKPPEIAELATPSNRITNSPEAVVLGQYCQMVPSTTKALCRNHFKGTYCHCSLLSMVSTFSNCS